MNQFIGTTNEPKEAAVVIALCLAPSLRICYSSKCGGNLCREHCAKRLRYALARHWWLWVAFVAETSRGAIYWKMGVRLCTRHYDWNMNQGFKVDSSHVLRGTWRMAQSCSVSADVVQVCTGYKGYEWSMFNEYISKSWRCSNGQAGFRPRLVVLEYGENLPFMEDVLVRYTTLPILP